MCYTLMPRSNRTFKIDDRVLEALDRLAQKSNTSANRYIETLLLSHAKQLGEIPMTAEPLGDTRGGKRQGAGRKSRHSSESGPSDPKASAPDAAGGEVDGGAE
jgi:predicted transcriptional regulator